MAIIDANLLKKLEIRRYIGGFVSGVFARFYLIQNYCVSENNVFQLKNNERGCDTTAPKKKRVEALKK